MSQAVTQTVNPEHATRDAGRPASNAPPQDCPILVWNLSLNREYTQEEYDAAYKVIQEGVPHVNIAYKPEDGDTFRHLMMYMLPLLMMRHRRIPKSKWRDQITPNGKHWIEQLPDDMPPEKFLYSMIGYHLECENSLCSMAMTQGIQRKVINLGLGIKQLVVEPRGVSISTYLESLAHKLTPNEMAQITSEQNDESILRRLCTILALKIAYIRAVGQPVGFDYSRLEFNVPSESAMGDGHPLQGWEFRIYQCNLGVARGERLIQERYLCVTAFFRGTMESSFIMYKNVKDLEGWVQFINIDQIMKVVPKLSA